jgi:UDP-glucose:(heptosyl)LPS alpha-1,3-glucosyltransferase
MHIVQIAPEIAPGSGVAMVAFALEREFVAAGVTVERFTLEDARGRPAPAHRSRLGHAWDVVWFSTIGTARAKRFLTQRPDAVTICHNDAMVGDIYVNHGLLPAAMRARGHYAWRMIRNPLHVFTAVRDRIRYRGRTHRAIVALSATEADLLVREYGRVSAPITVIGNGVDLDRFRPGSAEQRERLRRELGIAADAYVMIFIGNEFERKGLPLVIDALPSLPEDAVLLVVGGTDAMIAQARDRATRTAGSARVSFVGAHADVVPFLSIASVLVLPSAYEANALVLLEALACGVPVVATAVGFAPDLIDGRNGRLVRADASDVATGVRELYDSDRGRQRDAARWTAARFGWPQVADTYLQLAERVRMERAR